MSRHFYYEPSKPIKTDKGIKAKSKRGKFVESWWADRWIKALTHVVNAGRLQRGRTYARKGQVIALDETKEGILAKVQGSSRTPYKITISLTPLTDDQWDIVIAALTERAIFSAQLLAGEMPPDIEEVFETAGVSLFPKQHNDLKTDCSCPDYATVCKHLAATHYILGERFDEDPFLLFRLRGRSEKQIMNALRQSGAGDETALLDPAPPLEDSLTSVWQADVPLTHLSCHIAPPTAPLPILRRLGQPRFVSGDLEALLAPAYNSMTKTVLDLAFKEQIDATTAI